MASTWVSFRLPAPFWANAPSVLAFCVLAAASQAAKIAQNVGTVDNSEPWAGGSGTPRLQAASLGVGDSPPRRPGAEVFELQL